MEKIGMQIRWLIVLASLIVLTLTLPAAPPYRVVDVKEGGTITGVVKLQGELPRSLEFEITKDKDWCGKKKMSPRLVLGKSRGVRNAVISLENIVQGKKNDSSGKHVLDQRKCEYDPHVLLLLMGAEMEIVNSDAVLHNVHTFGAEQRTLFNIAQPIKGVRFPVKSSQFKVPGVYRATCDAGHPWMSAYVVIAEHPYYVLTDANGKFTLTDIPPGTYRLRMWHEGVAVIRTEMDGGKPKSFVYEEPYEEFQNVTVPPKGNAVADFILVLRSGVVPEK